MSQEAVEILLGKILTDDEVRGKFFRNPHEACYRLGLDLTEVELDALRRVPLEPVRQLATRLDPRIVRAVIGQPKAGTKESRRLENTPVIFQPVSLKNEVETAVG